MAFKKIKIAFVIDSLSIGGAERITLDVIRNMNTEVFEILLISLFSSSEQNIISLKTYSNLNIISLNLREKGYFSRIILLKKYLKDYDVIHSCLESSNLYCSIVNILFLRKKKFISTVHGVEGIFLAKIFGKSSIKYVFLIKYLQNFLFKFYDLFFAVSEDSRKKFIENRKINPNRIKTIYYGMDFSSYPQISEKDLVDVKTKYDIKNNDYIMGYIGRITYGKGLEELVMAYDILRRKSKKMKLIFVGDGELLIDLKYKCHSLGISDKECLFTGFKKNVTQFYEIINLFILPSYSEGIPVTVFEAMHYKKVIICSSVGGIPEIIKDGFNGYLFSPGNIQIMIEKIEYVINNIKLMKNIQENAEKSVRFNFDLKQNVKKMEEYIESLFV